MLSTCSFGRNCEKCVGSFRSKIFFSLPVKDVQSKFPQPLFPASLLSQIRKLTPHFRMLLSSACLHWSDRALMSCSNTCLITLHSNTSVIRSRRCSSSGTTWCSSMLSSGMCFTPNLWWTGFVVHRLIPLIVLALSFVYKSLVYPFSTCKNEIMPSQKLHHNTVWYKSLPIILVNCAPHTCVVAVCSIESQHHQQKLHKD